MVRTAHLFPPEKRTGVCVRQREEYGGCGYQCCGCATQDLGLLWCFGPPQLRSHLKGGMLLLGSFEKCQGGGIMSSPCEVCAAVGNICIYFNTTLPHWKKSSCLVVAHA